MAVFCQFWRITPAQFWDLDLSEYHAMLRLMDKHKEDADRANRRASRKR